MTTPHTANPPPTGTGRPRLRLDLVDDGRTVGSLDGDVVAFRGFADETEAAHAAWVAYRTLARRLARSKGVRPAPIDTEPLALQRDGDGALILASGHPIARLVRHAPGTPDGSLGFEITVPAPADELRVRAMGHLLYRTLRKSGVRWAMWTPVAAPVAQRAPVAQPAPIAAPATAHATRHATGYATHGWPAWWLRLLAPPSPGRPRGRWAALSAAVPER